MLPYKWLAGTTGTTVTWQRWSQESSSSDDRIAVKHGSITRHFVPFTCLLATMAPALCGLDISPNRAEISTSPGLGWRIFAALLSSHPAPKDTGVTYLNLERLQWKGSKVSIAMFALQNVWKTFSLFLLMSKKKISFAIAVFLLSK